VVRFPLLFHAPHFRVDVAIQTPLRPMGVPIAYPPPFATPGWPSLPPPVRALVIWFSAVQWERSRR
jgi:hypothetical protein